MTFHFDLQGKWNSEMELNFEIVCFEFPVRLKLAICQPAKKKGNVTVSPLWNVIIRMPKLQTVIAHVSQFVRDTGCWGKLVEEEFEHFQRTVADIREQNSRSRPASSQICSNMYFSWIRCMSDVAVQRCKENTKLKQTDSLWKKSHALPLHD